MKKTICFVGCMDAGGAETFLMKIFRTMDRSKYSMDFIASREGVYDEEIRNLGGRIFYVPLKSKAPIRYAARCYRILKNGNYDAAMCMSFCSHNAVDLVIAKVAGIQRLAMRSTNAPRANTISKKCQLSNKVFSFLPKRIPNVKFGPSKLATEYLFGEKAVKSGEAFVINNGICIDEFRFKKDIRMNLRRELGLEDKFVVLHVGRLSEQKNHTFLLEVFKDVLQKRNNAVLVLVGTGELEETIREKALQLNISNEVIFLGVRSDVCNLLSMADVFCFPSFFEGMPNTVIEAQTSGLPCLISSSITPEAKVTEVVKMNSLKRTSRRWAEALIKLYEDNKNNNRSEFADTMRQHGYAIEDVETKFVDKIFEEE